MEFTGSAMYYHLSPIYTLFFFFLVGFIYHLIRNNEYKDTLLASIIIGFILAGGAALTTWLDNWMILGWSLAFMVLVIIGGLVAVGIKKLLFSNFLVNR